MQKTSSRNPAQTKLIIDSLAQARRNYYIKVGSFRNSDSSAQARDTLSASRTDNLNHRYNLILTAKKTHL